jgi:DNA-binding NtrC family response regulator
VPPLRERREDIPALVRHFIARLGPKENRGQVRDISPAALAMLCAYDWPGNIRQLENAVFRAVVLAEGDVLTAEDFPQIRTQVEGVVETETPELPAMGGEAHLPPGSGEFDEAAAAESRNVSGRYGILRALDDSGNVRTLAEIELEQIRLAIDHYSGQMSEVARRLGIGRSTLYRKLKEYGIDPESGRAG